MRTSLAGYGLSDLFLFSSFWPISVKL